MDMTQGTVDKGPASRQAPWPLLGGDVRCKDTTGEGLPWSTAAAMFN